MKQSRSLYQVDAFADRPFVGNPAAVCLLEEPAGETWMQLLAREMNLSETAFLYPTADGYHLRWFTPATEVNLCGHATLASAHILFETGALTAAETARFQTRSGDLSATLDGAWIQMDFPATPPLPVPAPADLVKAMSAEFLYCGESQGLDSDFLVELASAEALAALGPDMGLLAGLGTRGVIATARSTDPDYDFLSRYFAPAYGIPEDPVTGSAHCTLAPYWGEKLGKSELTGYQASQRGGVVQVAIRGDRIQLGGQAVTVARIELADSAA